MEKPLGIILIISYFLIGSILNIVSGFILIIISSSLPPLFILYGLLSILLATFYLSSCYGLWSRTTWVLNFTRFTIIFGLLINISCYFMVQSSSLPIIKDSIKFEFYHVFFYLVDIIIFIYISSKNIKYLYQGKEIVASNNIEFSSPRDLMLYGLSGHLANCALELDHGNFVIGRDPRQSNIIIPDNNISKRHLLLRPDVRSGSVILEDLGSRNGTFLASGQRINPGNPQHLRPGDRFYLADRKNIFEIRLKE